VRGLIAVSKLVTPTGEILVPGVKEMIAPVTQDEREKFEAIHFEMKVRELRHMSLLLLTAMS